MKNNNGNTFLKINQNSKNSMLTFDCFTTREIMREREKELKRVT